jgi:O-acetyl-ADP-ribose deacetylase (regulator of RNase III)
MGLSTFHEEHSNGHTLEYKVGDLFAHTPTTGPTVKVIAHVCNDIGGWGSGFVVPLARKYPEAEAQYREWHRQGFSQNQTFELGHVSLVPVQAPDFENNEVSNGTVIVSNMIAQHGTISTPAKGRKNVDKTPLRYWALAQCMKRLADAIDIFPNAGVIVTEFHVPKFGSDLAGGDWNVIETLIEEMWVPVGNVTVYTLE